LWSQSRPTIIRPSLTRFQKLHKVNRQPGEKAIVVFTDGDDNASVLTAQAAVNRARKNEFPLFTPVEGEGTQSQQLKKILSDLSKSSGGEAYEITRFWSLTV
jgi:hypothetical protein